MESHPLKNAVDIELARRAAAGDVAAWHEFVLSYSALIRALVRRYYYGWPEDDQLNLYVSVLEYLHAQGLARYDGRAALSTWIMTVTRSRCLDALRHELGRRRPPKWLLGLSPFEQEVYRLHFMECVPIPALQARLQRQGHAATMETLETLLDALGARMDRQSRKRLAYDLKARSVGALSGRVLETMDQLRLELDDLAEACRPDHALFESRTRQLLSEVEACVHQLGEPERRVIELRFYDEMSAPGIARHLNLPGPRHVHSLIHRAIDLLRGMLERRTEPPLPGDGTPPLKGSLGST